MPLPQPGPTEDRQDFLDRFMADEKARREFPDAGARFAVAAAEWDKRAAKLADVPVNARYVAFARSFGVELPPRTLYVERKLLNAPSFAAWAKAQGFPTTTDPAEIHVTVCYSKGVVPWHAFAPDPGPLVVSPGPDRTVEPLGSEGAVVLKFGSPELQARHLQFREGGATWDYPGYQSHVTISYEAGAVDLEKVKPYAGELVFGPEVFAEIDDEWRAGVVEKGRGSLVQIVKAEPMKQLVYGWFSVIEKDGVPVVDVEGDVISEDDLLHLVHTFNAGPRISKLNHDGQPVGRVVELACLTRDVQKAMGCQLDRAGAWGCSHIEDPGAWARVLSGEFTGFSWDGLSKRIRRT
jgi:hypothetical protein